jgi:hypothetical protein
MVEALEDIDFLTTQTGLKPGAANPGAIAEPERYHALIPISVEHARREMRWVLDAQDAATTERLAQWRKRAQRWHDDAEQLELFGAQRSKVGKLGQRINDEQRLADLLAPTQQLVRPLLIIVPTNTPVGKEL